MVISFKTAEELKAYKEHVVRIAEARFDALGLGPKTPEMKDAKVESGPWLDPHKAAGSGLKLIITGPVGSGKTTLLKRVVWGLALRRWKVRGGFLPTVLNSLKGAGSDEFQDWLLEGNLLVIDDLDKLRGTQYEGDKMLAILNHYDVNRLPVIVTLNTNMGLLAERMKSGGVPADYAEAIVSRLNNRSSTYLVDGPDRRKAS